MAPAAYPGQSGRIGPAAHLRGNRVPEFTENVVVTAADLRVTDANGADIVRINDTGRVIVRRAAGGGATEPVLTFEPSDAELIVGSIDRNGRITLVSQDGGTTIALHSGDASIDVGAADTDGDVRVHAADGVEVLHLDGGNARLVAGATGHAGKLVVQDDLERVVMRMEASTGVLTVGAEDDSDVQTGEVIVRGQLGRDAIRLDGGNAVLTVGGVGNEGDLVVTDGNGFEAFRVNGDTASVTIGGGNLEGDLIVRDLFGRDAVHINGEHATVTIGAVGLEGDLVIRDAVGRDALVLNGETAELFLGSEGLEGDLIVRDAEGVDRIHLNGATGDIELMGADLAEEFAADAEIPAGTVVVAVGADEVTASATAHDRRVVGVVSGAGDFRTALRLGARRGEARVPVALVGRVHCRAVAADGAIEIGDLLVTSDLAGHATRAPRGAPARHGAGQGARWPGRRHRAHPRPADAAVSRR